MPDASLVCRPVADEMAALVQQWQATGDRRAIFLDCYLRMTRAMIAALDAGEFQDAAWVDRLLHRFAGYYFAACQAYERDRFSAPAVWRIAHDAARNAQTLTLQHLLLGVNAHINYDLVLVMVELLQPEWTQLAEDQRHQRYADYAHINTIIARTIDEVQDEIVEPATPALRIADALLGRVDEWATERLIASWREEVWRHAAVMLAAPDATAYEAQRQAAEAATLQRAAWMVGHF